MTEIEINKVFDWQEYKERFEKKQIQTIELLEKIESLKNENIMQEEKNSIYNQILNSKNDEILIKYMKMFGYNDQMWEKYLKCVSGLGEGKLLDACFSFLPVIDRDKTIEAAVQLYKAQIILYSKDYDKKIVYDNRKGNYNEIEIISYLNLIEKIINNAKQVTKEMQVEDLLRVSTDVSHSSSDIIELAILLNEQNNESFINALLDFAKEGAYIVYLASFVNEKNMKKLEDKIIEMGQFRTIYNFLCTVRGCNKQRLKKKLIEILKSDSSIINRYSFNVYSECVLSEQEYDELVLELKSSIQKI